MVKMIKEGKFIKLSDLLSKALHNHMGECGLMIVSKKGIPQNYPLLMHKTAEKLSLQQASQCQTAAGTTQLLTFPLQTAVQPSGTAPH